MDISARPINLQDIVNQSPNYRLRPVVEQPHHRQLMFVSVQSLPDKISDAQRRPLPH